MYDITQLWGMCIIGKKKNPTNIAEVIWRRRSRRVGTTDAADEWELALFVESSWTLSSQLYFSVSEFFFTQSVQNIRNAVMLYKPIPARPWPLLDVSSPWLLLAVSVTRHIQRKTLLAFLLSDSITQRFNYATFQRSRMTDRPKWDSWCFVTDSSRLRLHYEFYGWICHQPTNQPTIQQFIFHIAYRRTKQNYNVNEDRPILSAAKYRSVNKKFIRYKVCENIRRDSAAT